MTRSQPDLLELKEAIRHIFEASRSLPRDGADVSTTFLLRSDSRGNPWQIFIGQLEGEPLEERPRPGKRFVSAWVRLDSGELVGGAGLFEKQTGGPTPHDFRKASTDANDVSFVGI
jgi:hypothetical protein